MPAFRGEQASLLGGRNVGGYVSSSGPASAPFPAEQLAGTAATGAAAATTAGIRSIPNLRDVSTVHGSIVPGVLFRCGCPDFATEADAAALVGQLGVTARIDLRSPRERPSSGQHPMFRDGDGRRRHCGEVLDRQRGMSSHRVPMSSASRGETGGGFTQGCGGVGCAGVLRTCGCICTELCVPRCCRSRARRRRTLESTFAVWRPAFLRVRMSDSYTQLCGRGRPAQTLGAVLRMIAATPDGNATLVHCTAGKDRTGVVVALALALCGVPREAIAADYALSDNIYERWVAAGVADPDEPGMHLAAAARIPFMCADKQDILTTLDVLEQRFGSIEAWATQAAGLEALQLEALRRRLLRPKHAV
jgi:protein tyrosine/serine phosphatase